MSSDIKTPEQIIEGMAIWFKFGPASSVRDRTVEQQAWDSAILAAAEYVRRRMNLDEKLSLEIIRLMTPCSDDRRRP